MSRYLGTIWLDTHWNELREHNNKWVAVARVNERTILESNESLSRLAEIINRMLEREELSLADFAFTFVTFEGIQ